MKHQALRIVTMLSLFVLVGASVYGQSPLMMKANIPFDFTVGKATLPAGEYEVKPIGTGQSAQLIQREDRQASAIVLTNGIQGRTTSAEGKLVFNRYGNQYFLSQIWKPGDSHGRELRKSKLERELALGPSTNREAVSLAANMVKLDSQKTR